MSLVLDHMILENCTNMDKHFDEVLVCYTHRSANIVAHSLARATYSMSGLTEWNVSAPNFIICMLDSEKY